MAERSQALQSVAALSRAWRSSPAMQTMQLLSQWWQELRQTQIMFNFSDKSKLDITVIPLILNFRKQTCIFKLSHHESPLFNFFLLQENDLSRLFYTAYNSKIIFKRHGIIAKYILKTDKAIKLIQNWTVKFKKVWEIYIIWNLVHVRLWSYPYKGAVAFLTPQRKAITVS